jgi:hypothetical protein
LRTDIGLARATSRPNMALWRASSARDTKTGSMTKHRR